MNNLVLFPDDSREEANAELNAPVRKNGVSRLMRDLREWHRSKEEFPCIEGVPLDDNIFEWHCNICPDSGDFKDVVFHLIILFDESYPVKPPRVKLCTTIPHPNVFGDWICLDMIERFDVGKKYQGWSPGYSVTSILMQLQSFLFEQSNVDQMEFHDVNNAARIFDPVLFNRVYMPEIKRFVCDKCGHCYSKPFPVTVSIANKQKKKQKMNKKQKHNGDCDNGGIVGYNYNNNHEASIASVKKSKKNKQKKKGKNKQEQKKGKNKVLKSNFCFWDGIYRDLEITIFGFFNLKDLMKIKRVAKRFQYLVHNTKIIQKDSIKCWFHRSLTLPTKELKSKAANKDKYNDDDMSMLCLGFGATPTYFEDESKSTTLRGQIFGNDLICDQIGHFSMIPSIDTTFDLLSSDAFVNFGIRKTVFNDRQFTHFIPLYLNEKHGKKAMKKMDKFILKIWNKDSKKQVINECHPWLKLYTIANMMKSLIVSVMKESDDNDGSISLHYSINILEAFFRLHHTLMGIYFYHKKEISRLVQHQIKMFFRKQKGDYPYRSKTFIPDFGVFLSYFTLFEDRRARTWEEIAYQLLDETFTRQSKWILNAHSGLIDSNYCPLKERVLFRWKTSKISNRLFMFNSFFFRECCQLGNQSISLEEQFKLYNENFGFPSDDGLAFKLQKFVKKLYCDVKDYSQFFEMVGVPYPGMKQLGLWFLDCMNNSEYRGYHKRYLYEPKGKMDARRRALQEQKKKEWLRQQQLEREQNRKKYKKQQQIKQRQELRRRKKQAKRRKRSQKNGKDVIISASVRYSIPRSRTSAGVASVRLDEINVWYDYVRVNVNVHAISRDEIASVDAMYFDGIGEAKRVPLLRKAAPSGRFRNFRWNEVVPELKEALTDMFNQFANGKNNTMTRRDFNNYLVHCGASTSTVKERISSVFGNNCNRLDLNGFIEFYRQACMDRLECVWMDLSKFGYGNDLRKPKKCNDREIVAMEAYEEQRMNLHYPDENEDGNITIRVHKIDSGRYYADFSIDQLLERFNYDLSNIRPRIVGKRVDGRFFTLQWFTLEQNKRRQSYAIKQNEQLENKLKTWKLSQLKLEATSGKRERISKYETGVKVPIGAQIMAGGFGSEVLPVVQFSISTIKGGKVSHNVRCIGLDCDTVRVLVRVVSGNIGSFDGIYFDGEMEENEEQQNTQKRKLNWAMKKETNKNKVNQTPSKSVISVNGAKYVSYPDCDNGDLNIDVGGPIDEDLSVYYGDVSVKLLFNRFGRKLRKGISPRVKGVTFRGNKFYCCGGSEYMIGSKFRQEMIEEKKREQVQQQQRQPIRIPTIPTQMRQQIQEKTQISKPKPKPKQHQKPKEQQTQQVRVQQVQQQQRPSMQRQPKPTHPKQMEQQSTRQVEAPHPLQVHPSSLGVGQGYVQHPSYHQQQPSYVNGVNNNVNGMQTVQVIRYDPNNPNQLYNPIIVVLPADQVQQYLAMITKHDRVSQQTLQFGISAQAHAQMQAQSQVAPSQDNYCVNRRSRSGPQAAPHALHNGAKPRRPPMAAGLNGGLWRQL